MTILHNKDILRDRRRGLRKISTSEEKILWASLRNGKLGHKFKRQHSVGGYILDFYCHEKRLVIEIDGPVHSNANAREYDKTRDEYFEELEYTTIRFLNGEIKNNLQEVLKKIRKFLNPSPFQGEG